MNKPREIQLGLEELEERIAPGLPLGQLGGDHSAVLVDSNDGVVPCYLHVPNGRSVPIQEAAAAGLVRAIAGGGA